MKKFTLSQDRKYIVEQPVIPIPFPDNLLKADYGERLKEYEHHISSLIRYPAEGFEGYPLDGELVEGKDFKLCGDDNGNFQIARPLSKEPTGKEERLWIKVGENLIQEIDRKLLAEDVIDVDFGGHYKLQITNEGGTFKVTNAMNGYGHNCRPDFENENVTFLTEESKLFLGQSPASSPSPSPEPERIEKEAMIDKIKNTIHSSTGIGFYKSETAAIKVYEVFIAGAKSEREDNYLAEIIAECNKEIERLNVEKKNRTELMAYNAQVAIDVKADNVNLREEIARLKGLMETLYFDPDPPGERSDFANRCWNEFKTKHNL